MNYELCFELVWISPTQEAILEICVCSAESVAEVHLNAIIGERLHLVIQNWWSIYVYCTLLCMLKPVF